MSEGFQYKGQLTYKIKLVSGRVLGPLAADRIKLLILKNQITGVEVAREYPRGDWKDINQIPELAVLLLASAEGKLHQPEGYKKFNSDLGVSDSVGATRVLGSSEAVLPGATQVVSLGPLSILPENSDQKEGLVVQDQSLLLAEPLSETNEKTSVSLELKLPTLDEEDEKTRVDSELILKEESGPAALEEFFEQNSELSVKLDRNLSQEKTVFFQRSTNDQKLPGKRKKGIREIFTSIPLVGVLCYLGYSLFLNEPVQQTSVRAEPIRPKLPEYIQGKSDPKKSSDIYLEAMKDYLLDTVSGYKAAANNLRIAASYDTENVKALAMLASSYINLIDSSNKDENYFSVISKLIEMSRAKNVDLPETVIADVEFFLVVNKAEAAQNRIVEYTQSHQNYGVEMFYYLALSCYYRGDPTSAAKYLSHFPDNKAFSSKIFYLRGLIAEKLEETESAVAEYDKALKFSQLHAKSHLKRAILLSKQGKLKEAAPFLDFIMKHPDLLPPIELGQAYYLHCQLSELYEKWALALGDVERAVKLDPENHEYLLELYTLRAKAGESLQVAQKQARMYYFLGEGEKLIQAGKYQEALVPLLQAREANDESPLPLLKIGNMFFYLRDIENAKINFKLAAARAPDDIQVWSKYIDILIQSYEWDEAQKAMDKFRNMKVSQSAIDKAAADMYQKQGRFLDAQAFYRKAMARDSIDSAVYIAYAKNLMFLKNYKDAPFFFALALRFDPLNFEAIIEIAKCVAETESVTRAISLLVDELQKGTSMRAEYLAAIAELQMQKGAWTEAQKNIEQAMQANPQYAYPWKLQGQMHMNREGSDRDALNKALFAYKSYSERNPSDPSGYLERYRIFIKKTNFEFAKEELNRIYEIYPKYPNLHFYLGSLYSIQGNHRVAAEEFVQELKNNPDSLQAVVALGKEFIENGQPQEALKQFTKAMQLAPGSAEAKQNAGWANYLMKNYASAVGLIQSAITIDRGNPVLFKRLGTIYKDMGDATTACDSFKKYIQMEPDASDKAQFAYCF